MKTSKRLIAATAAAVLSTSAVPVFAQEITDKVYVANAIENTLKAMSTDDSYRIYEEIAKNAYAQNMKFTLKDYTLPENILEKDIFDGYSLSIDTNVEPKTFDMFYSASLANPKGDTLSAKYVLGDSAIDVTVPEIMDYYLRIGDSIFGEEGKDLLDVQGKSQKIMAQMENLKNEVEVKVVGPVKTDANLTQAQVTLKAEDFNQFVNDYLGLYQLADATEKVEAVKNDIVVDLTINKENIVTAFSTTIKEPIEDIIYDYNDVTFETTETKVTRNMTFDIDGTYLNDKFQMNFSLLEDENEVLNCQFVNQDTRNEAKKIASSKANMLITVEGATVNMDIDAAYKADGNATMALKADVVAKSDLEGVADEKHTLTLSTAYKTTVTDKEVKVNMPTFDVNVDGMVFNCAFDYSLASEAFKLPEYKTVNIEELTEEATTQLQSKGLLQLNKVLPQSIMDKLMQQ